VEVQSTKLIVRLIKQEENRNNPSIDPAEMLMVEIDKEVDRPEYLSRGLGLGALICSAREKIKN
jgi:hypothetical protein